MKKNKESIFFYFNSKFTKKMPYKIWHYNITYNNKITDESRIQQPN